MDETRMCHDAEVELNANGSAVELNDNLVEILYPLPGQLYERFSFFELPVELVRAEIARMK